MSNLTLKPEPRTVISSLSAALIGPSAIDSLLDVKLNCNDEKVVKANKTLLVARSCFFKNLLCSSFAEAETSSATLPIRSNIVEEVLHFIYTDDSPLIRGLIRGIAPGYLNSFFSLDIMNEVIELATAADYLQVSRLVRIVGEAISRIPESDPSLTCLIVETIHKHQDGALRHCNMLDIWGAIFVHDLQCFGISYECNLGTNASTGSPSNSLCVRKPTVIDFSSEAIRFLIESLPDPPTSSSSNKFKLIQYRKWLQNAFEGLHIWAMKGVQICKHRSSPGAAERCQSSQIESENKTNLNCTEAEDENTEQESNEENRQDEHEAVSPTSNANIENRLEEKCVKKRKRDDIAPVGANMERWAFACSLASRMKIEIFEISFLLNFVEYSGLVPYKRLYAALRKQVTGETDRAGAVPGSNNCRVPFHGRGRSRGRGYSIRDRYGGRGGYNSENFYDERDLNYEDYGY